MFHVKHPFLYSVSPNSAQVLGDGSLIGRYIDVRITGSNTWALFGETL